MDGTELRVPIAGKWVKIFKKRTGQEPYVGNADDKEQSDEDHDNAESEESELRLIVDIREESGSATDKDGDDA
jgi:Sec-independent protein translocase protein TatA